MIKLFKNRWLLAIISSLVLFAFYWFANNKTAQEPVAPPLANERETQTQSIEKDEDLAVLPSTSENKAPMNSAQECENFLLPRPEAKAWRKEKRQMLRELLLAQKEQGVESLVLDEFFKRTAIGLESGRAFLNGYISESKHPRYSARVYERASKEEFQKALTAVFSDDLITLTSAVRSKELPSNKSYSFESVSYTLFTFLRKASKRPQQVVDELLNSGIEISLADLAYGTIENFNIQTLERMMLMSNQDSTQTLRDRHHLTSFALLALKHQNWSGALFWLNNNSPAEVDAADHNALDILAEHIQTIPVEQASELFSAIVKQGVNRAQYRSIVTLKNHFHEASLKPLVAQLSVKKTLSQQQFDYMKSLTERYYFELLDGGVSFDLSQTPKHRCFDYIGRWLSRYVANPPKGVSAPAAAKPKEAAEPLTSEQLAEQSRALLQTKVTQEQAESDQSLESKLLLEQTRMSQLNALAKSFSSELQDKKEDPQYKQIEQIFALAQRGQWQKALELARDLQVDGAGVYASLLVVAINSDADFTIIKQLIERGAVLDSTIMTTLIAKNNVELTKRLLPYGLDIHEYAMGYSTLARAVQHKAKAMLRYLLAKDVAIDSDSVGLDALDLALRNYGITNPDTDYIRLLVEAGAEIEPSHLQLFERIKQKDISLYSQLLNAVPALGAK